MKKKHKKILFENQSNDIFKKVLLSILKREKIRCISRQNK